MKVVIAGSRDGVSQVDVDIAMFGCPFVDQVTTVISGTARGADTFGEVWAREHGVALERQPANWNKYGKRAGYIRNEEMARGADALVLVWDGKSRGSMHMKMIAASRGLRIHEYVVQQEDSE